MAHIIFITHAEVNIEPQTPVPEWRLSSIGIRRHEAFNKSPLASSISSIYCSNERKAMDGAQILSHHLKIPFEIVPALHENDRSATGYLPQAEFQRVADTFFANPLQSVQGWERAIDARTRIYEALVRIVERDQSEGNIALISHGGVGALLMCKLASTPISRSHEQPGAGGGNFFVVDKSSLSIVKPWAPIDV